MFWATNVVTNSDKENYVHGGYRITFGSAGSWDSGIDNSSSSHSDNQKNNFLMLGVGSTYGINGSFGSPEKKSNSFTKENPKCCLSLD